MRHDDVEIIKSYFLWGQHKLCCSGQFFFKIFNGKFVCMGVVIWAATRENLSCRGFINFFGIRVSRQSRQVI